MTARYTHPTTRRRVLRPGDVVTHRQYPEWGQGIVTGKSIVPGEWYVSFPGRGAMRYYQRELLVLVERDGAKLSDRVEPEATRR